MKGLKGKVSGVTGAGYAMICPGPVQTEMLAPARLWQKRLALRRKNGMPRFSKRSRRGVWPA